MGINEGMISTNGLDIEDVKAILLHRREVVNIEEYLTARDANFELIALCALAVNGDKKAIQYFNDSAEVNFKESIYDDMKEDVLIFVKNFLDNKYPDEELKV